MQGHRRCVHIVFTVEALEGVGERIKILARAYSVLGQCIHYLIAAGTKEIFVKHHREVGIVGPDLWLLHIQAQTVHAFQMLTVALHYGPALGDLLIHMTQIAQTHSGTELVHLGVSAHGIHRFRAVNAKVFQLVQPAAHIRVPIADRTALNGVEHLGGMEAEAGGIAKITDALPFIGLAKGVSRIVQHLQTILVGDALDLFDVADIAVDMYRQDGTGAVGDEPLDLGHIHGVGLGVDITEHRFQSIAHDGVGGGRKSERRGDDLALQIHGLQRKLQRHVAVGEQLHSRHAHVLLQFSLQGFVFFAHVGQPVAVPDGADLFNVFFHAGHGGTGNKDIIVQFCSPFRS